MGDDICERLCGCGASMSRNEDGEWECDNFEGCDAGSHVASNFALEEEEEEEEDDE